jgi:hypothetical protein
MEGWSPEARLLRRSDQDPRLIRTTTGKFSPAVSPTSFFWLSHHMPRSGIWIDIQVNGNKTRSSATPMIRFNQRMALDRW